MSRARNERRKKLREFSKKYKFVTRLNIYKEVTKVLTGVSELEPDKKVRLMEYVNLRRVADKEFSDNLNKIAETIKSVKNESTISS